MSAYDDLLKRITVFINRYYTVRLLKGLFLSVGLGIGLFLFLITLEFFFRFNSLTRGLLLSFFVVTSGWFVLLNVINPLLRLLHWAKAMSHRNAAVQLGQYFDGISDKILSAIELKEKQYPGESAALIVAAVEQKAIDLRLFPIERALSLNKSFKYLKYGVIPILLFAMAYFAVPDLVIGGSERLVNYQKEFAIQAPFQFKIDISQFEVVKGKDAPISVSLNGESLPESVTVEWNGEPFRMSAEGKGAFAYLFRNVQKGGNIRFLAAGYSSDVWELKVMPNPKVIEVSAEIDYPDYTGKPDEVVTNPLHLSLPEGSNYTLNIVTESADYLLVVQDSIKSSAALIETNNWEVKGTTTKYAEVHIIPQMSGRSQDSFLVRISPQKDAFPEIQAEMFTDSLAEATFYFQGIARDDYGISKLEFVVIPASGGIEKVIELNGENGGKLKSFHHFWQLEKDEIISGESYRMFFRAWDNDAINGRKSSTSETFVFRVPGKDDLQAERSETTKGIEERVIQELKRAENVQKQIEAFRKKLVEQKNVSFEEKRQLSGLLQQQKNMRESIDKMRDEYKRSNEKQRLYNEETTELMEKQRQLEELFKNVLDEELLKELEALQKKLEDMSKDQIKDALDKVELNNDDLKKELDRSLALMKQLEFEQQLEFTKEKLKQLAEEQKKLASDDEKSADKQDNIQKKLEETKKEIETLKEKNQQLEEPQKIPDVSQEMKKAGDEMNSAANQIKAGGGKKKAGQAQRKAAEELQKAADKMQQFQDEMEQEQETEDLQMLRRLRQNLLTLSFDQEKQITALRNSGSDDPLLVQITRNQRKLIDNTKVVEDSLTALAKRNVEISGMVNKEVGLIATNMEKAVAALAERNRGEGLNRQQLVMTSINNLAVMLDESIKSAQQKQAQKKFGNKSCSKPGQGKPKPGSMRKEQEGLSKQMQELKKRLEQQGKTGEKKKGQKPSSRGSGLSEDMAKAAARQAAIREQLRKMMEELGGDPGVQQQLKRLDQLMEQNEKDLLNFELDNEALRRQEEIITRLLESEKAEREQREDPKRESKSARDFPTQDSVLKKYLRDKQRQSDLLETKPLNMSVFYRERVDYFFKQRSEGEE